MVILVLLSCKQWMEPLFWARFTIRWCTTCEVMVFCTEGL